MKQRLKKLRQRFKKRPRLRPVERPDPMPRFYRWRTNLIQTPLLALITAVCGSISFLVSFVDKKERDKTLVGDITRPNIGVAHPGETALDAYKKMSKQETRRVVVLDPKNPQKLLGIITKADLLHALVTQPEETAKT